MRKRSWAGSVAVAMVAFTPILGSYVPDVSASPPSRIVLTKVRHATAGRALSRPGVLTLKVAHTPMMALQTGRVVASLSRPLGDGSISFVLLRPLPVATLYECAPVRGVCSMTWSRRMPGSVKLLVRWSGDRQYKAASASLTMTVRRAPFTSTGNWRGVPTGPLTYATPATGAVSLAQARLVGHLARFHTTDPAFSCLNGRALAVFVAPRTFPGDYVVHAAGRGKTCSAGTWLYPQTFSIAVPRPVVAAAGALFVLHGAFPPLHPYALTVTFAGRGRPQVGSVTDLRAATMTVRAPPHLRPGAYSVAIGWSDHVTGATVFNSSRSPLRFTVNSAVLPLVIPSTTKVLSGTTLRSLQHLSASSAVAGTQQHLTLTFSHATAQVRSLRPGDVLNAGITPSTPYGLLRKVTAMMVRGATVVVQTAPAQLSDAITQGVIHIHGVVRAQGGLQPHLKGASRPRLSSCHDVPFTPYSDGHGGTVTVDGNLCLSLSFDLTMRLNAFSPRVQTSFTVKASEQVHAQVQATVSRQVQQEKEIPIGDLGEYDVQVGPIAVLVFPKLALKVGIDGNASAGLSAGLVQQLDTATRLDCKDTNCALTPSVTPSLHADPVAMDAADQVTVYAGPELKLLLYDVAGPEFGVEGSLEAQADLAGNPWWTLTGGVKATIGITYDLDVFDLHGEKMFDLLSLQQVLAHAAGPFATIPTALPAAPTPTAVPPTAPSTPVTVTATATAGASPLPTAPPTDTATPTPCPELLTIAPSSGPPGTTVTVTYTDDCDPLSVNGQVFFNGQQVTAFTAPTDAGWSGPVVIPASAQDGDYSISVQDDDNSSQSVQFTVYGAPTDTPTPTDTPIPTDSPTPTDTPTATDTATETPTAEPTCTATLGVLASPTITTSNQATYQAAVILAGTKDCAVTAIVVNSSSAGVTYPDSTHWQVSVPLAIGDNTFTVYGTDNQGDQSGAVSITINRHRLGDINGDGRVDLTDLSMQATDFGKTDPSTFNYPLSDMNGDGRVDQTDVDILNANWTG